MNQTKPIEIFAPGKWQSSDGTTHSFSAADILSIAQSYDPAVHEAPVVVGHPKADAPAYAWVKSLAVDKDGKLVATPKQVDAQFAELVRDGKFKKISSSIYTPNAPNNPKPGSYYLRHVGFLGAQPPAVRGLRNPEFAEGEQGVIEFATPWSEKSNATMWRRLREFIIEKFSAEDADRVLPAWDVDSLESEATQSLTREDGMPPASSFTEQSPPGDEMSAQEKAELEQQKADLKKKQDDLDARDKQIAARERAQDRSQHVDFAEKLATDGRILPRQKAGVIELMSALDKSVVLDFSEGEKKPAAEWLRTFLSELPQQVDFSERAPGGDLVEQAGDAKAMAARARAYVAEQAKLGIDVNPSDAVKHISK